MLPSKHYQEIGSGPSLKIKNNEVNKMVEKSEKVDKPKSTLGFAVSGAPIWLCKELSKEAKKFYNDVYWPVIIDWYRKAKEYEYIMRGGLPSKEELHEELEVVENKPKEQGVQLMGGHVGRGGRK